MLECANIVAHKDGSIQHSYSLIIKKKSIRRHKNKYIQRRSCAIISNERQVNYAQIQIVDLTDFLPA